MRAQHKSADTLLSSITSDDIPTADFLRFVSRFFAHAKCKLYLSVATAVHSKLKYVCKPINQKVESLANLLILLAIDNK